MHTTWYRNYPSPLVSLVVYLLGFMALKNAFHTQLGNKIKSVRANFYQRLPISAFSVSSLAPPLQIRKQFMCTWKKYAHSSFGTWTTKLYCSGSVQIDMEKLSLVMSRADTHIDVTLRAHKSQDGMQWVLSLFLMNIRATKAIFFFREDSLR